MLNFELPRRALCSWLVLCALSCVVAACERAGKAAPATEAASAQAPVAVASVAAPAPTANAPESAWAGHWQGACNLEKTELKLPENQGVQIAWLKDTGKQQAGSGTLSCEVNGRGDANCRWTASAAPSGATANGLGEFSLFGVWDAPKFVSAELRSERKTGTSDELTRLTGMLQGEQTAPGTLSGALRLASGDGKTLRTGKFELKHSSQPPNNGSPQ